MWENVSFLTIGYLCMILSYRVMAYRQIGGQANLTKSWDVPGGQASTVYGGQARTVYGGQARTFYGGQASTSTDKLYRDQVSAKQKLPRCQICSYNQLLGQERKAIFHKHFTTKSVRECQGVEEQPGDYFCPTCKAIHTSRQNGRLKICVSSSTLHEFWAPRGGTEIYEGDAHHIDYITIHGAKIIDLVEAWKIDYFCHSRLWSLANY